MAHNGDDTVGDRESVPATPGILAIADCFDPASDNLRFLDLATSYVAAMGLDLTILNLRDLELPDYFEVADPASLPQGAHAFRQLLCAHDGFLVALLSEPGRCPTLLQNAIAWSVCPAFGAGSVSAYSGKCASLISTVGESETLLRTLTDARHALTQLGVLVLSDVFIIPAELPMTTSDALSPELIMRLKTQMQTFSGTIRWTQNHMTTES